MKKRYLLAQAEYACPPEDCGGIRGYYGMLDTLSNPESEDHEEVKSWIGNKIDIFALDTVKINKKLKAFSKKPSAAKTTSYWM